MPPTRFRRPLVAGLASVLLVVSGLSPAAGESAEQARAARERTRTERAKAAAKLNTLQASDDELEAAVAALDAQVAASEVDVAGARQATAAAQHDADTAAATAADMAGRVGTLRAAVTEAAVRLYVSPQPSPLSQLLDSEGLDAAVRRQALLQQVTGRQADVVDALRAAEADWRHEQDRAVTATALAGERQAQLETELAEVAEARDAQARVKADLDRRIAEVHREVDALAAEEANLTALIQRRQAEEAAAEAARRAAAARSGSGSGTSGPGGSTSTATSGSTRLAWPRRAAVTSEYGRRWGRLHAGLDIDGNTGDPIAAAGAGTVIFAGQQNGYGNVVIIDHGGGLSTLYAHQSRMAVSNGQRVAQGAVIGYVGTSGNVTGAHLHFEVRVNGAAQNPRRYLP